MKKFEVVKNKYKNISESKILKDPSTLTREKILVLNNLEKDLLNTIKMKMKDSKSLLEKNITALDSLSPLKTLLRGYSVLENENGDIITSVNSLKEGNIIKIVMNDGNKNAKII